jgi:hypothetical protein
VKFKVDGKLYQFDDDSFTFDEAELLEEHAGLTLAEFQPALAATKLRAIRAMVLIAKRRAGEQVEWADLGSMDLVELSLSLIEENGIDLATAANGQNKAAVAALTKRLADRKPKTTRKRAAE